MTPKDLLLEILVGSALGMLGQGIRVIVGLKKGYVQARDDGRSFTKEVFDPAQLMISLLIGAIAGTLGFFIATKFAVVDKIGSDLIVAVIAAGYAGTDFIEGFVKKYPVLSTGDAQGAPARGHRAGAAQHQG